MTQQDNGGVATFMDDYVYPGERFTQSGMKSGHGMGMTLRDWFAGQALAGMCANHAWMDDFSRSGTLEHTARAAYKMADALLAAQSAK